MAPSLKIGILTFHRCINYGSYWQARCLVEGLRALGHDAVLLDHHSSPVDRREWRCALDPQLPVSAPRDRPLHAIKIRRFLAAIEELPRSTRFELDRPKVREACDVVIVGSDEVWNLSHPWYGGQAAFYGRGLEARRLVSYAASFGNQRGTERLPSFWADALAAFARISVRDDNSAAIVRASLDIEPDLVLDPCLQFPPSVEPLPAAEPYVAVYGHSFPPWFSAPVRDWARRSGHRLISIGYRNDWADEQLIDAGPYSFAQSIAGAAAVATNFFHGCVFALLNGRPFACVSSAYRANKLAGLTRLVGAQRHLVGKEPEDSLLQRLLGAPPENAILRRMEDLRLRSRRFIDEAIAS